MSVTELSPRQRAVMQCIIDGLSYKEIALKLNIQSNTARKYTARVRQRVKAKSLYQCVALLVAQGVIVPADVEGPLK